MLLVASMMYWLRTYLNANHLRPRWLTTSLLWLSLSACGASPLSRPTVEGPLSLGEELRIGVIVSESNWRNLHRSTQLMDSSYLLRDRVNACGGINQTPMSIVIMEVDDAEHTEMKAMQTLIEEHRVHGVIAQFASQNPSQALALASKTDTPVLITSLKSWHTLIPVDRAARSWNYTTPSNQQRMKAFAQLIINRGYSQIALITANADETTDWYDLFVQQYDSLGGHIVNLEQPIAWKASSRSADLDDDQELTTDDDINQQIIQLKTILAQDFIHQESQTQPDQPQENSGQEGSAQETSDAANNVAIATILDQKTGADFLETILALGWQSEDVPMVWYDQGGLESFLTTLDAKDANDSQSLDAMAGIFGITPAFNGEGFQEFFDTWTKQLDNTPSGYAAHTWDAATLFALAAQASGQNSRTGIMSALSTVANSPGIAVTDVCQGLEHLRQQEIINFQGASSSVDINRFGEVPGMFNIWQLNKDGTAVTVDTLSIDTESIDSEPVSR
ncbi:MAG: ABC transporter substrate-binding protein [Cyanobacteria bacterium P01_A01_bin.37]